jgi:hypothetical protein
MMMMRVQGRAEQLLVVVVVAATQRAMRAATASAPGSALQKHLRTLPPSWGFH